MSDRCGQFLFSLLMIAGSLGAAGWLLVTGQAGTVDGLFMVLTALLVAAVFGLYVKFLIGRALQAAVQPKSAQEKSRIAGAASTTADSVT